MLEEEDHYQISLMTNSQLQTLFKDIQARKDNGHSLLLILKTDTKLHQLQKSGFPFFKINLEHESNFDIEDKTGSDFFLEIGKKQKGIQQKLQINQNRNSIQRRTSKKRMSTKKESYFELKQEPMLNNNFHLEINQSIEIINDLYLKNQFEKCQQFAQQTLLKYSKHIQPNQQAEILILLGNSASNQGLFKKSLQFYEKAKNLIFQPCLLGQIHNNLGTCYAQQNQFQKSLKNYQLALKYYQKSQNMDISQTLHSIGHIYLKFQMYEVAEKYFLQAAQNKKQQNKQFKTIIPCIFNAAQCLLKNKKPELALSNLKSIISSQHGEQLQQRFKNKIRYKIGSCYLQLKQWQNAIQNFKYLIQYQKKKGELFEKISYAYGQKGLKQNSVKYLQMALKEYKKEDNNQQFERVNKILSSNIKKKKQ